MTEEIREKVLEDALRRTDDHLHGMARQDWTTETLAIFYENQRLLSLSPPVDGGRGESARELRSSADAATTGSDQGSDSGTTRAKPWPPHPFCKACQAIPRHGYCNLPGCPTGYTAEGSR
jgi:hypothetical protein